MRSSKTTFLLLLAIFLSSRSSSLLGSFAFKAASVISKIGPPINQNDCIAFHSLQHAPYPVMKPVYMDGWTIASRMSNSCLKMATSSSDLKNDIKLTQTLNVTEDAHNTQEARGHRDPKKHETKQIKKIGNNVVSRLAKAAKDAAAAKKKQMATAEDKTQEERSIEGTHGEYSGGGSLFDDDDQTFEHHEDIPSILKLNSIIDEELLRPNDGYKPARETDSIRVLLEHNNNQIYNTNRSHKNRSFVSSLSASLSFDSETHKNKKNLKSKTDGLAPNDVAIVFARPLYKKKLTIEYAVRLMSLAKAMKFEGYRPNLICFCGPSSSSTSTTVDTSVSRYSSATTVGVKFFQQLCLANDISLEGIDLCRIPDVAVKVPKKPKPQQHNTEGDEGIYFSTFSEKRDSPSTFVSSWSPSSLSPVVTKLIDRYHLEDWLEESEVYESDTDEYGMTRQKPRKKIHIHWKLFSTEYHLCNLNDIHIRSPRQSPLARLVHELDHAANNEYIRRGIIQTTWSYHYSIYPYVGSLNKDEMMEAFLGKCFLMGQSLVPLLVNLKGVAENSEFFQRDNYRTLVATRRSLATYLEQMNEAYRLDQELQASTLVIEPTLKAQLKKQTSGSSSAISSIEIDLECALLSLGRCCDLVRPAGTFSEKSVSRQDWKDALLHLQEFMNRIESSCDPDRPVSIDQWGAKLSESQPVMELLL